MVDVSLGSLSRYIVVLISILHLLVGREKQFSFL